VVLQRLSYRHGYTFSVFGGGPWRQRKLNMQQTLQQLARVGPETLAVSMLTSSFVGMVFTIQFCQEFSKAGFAGSVTLHFALCTGENFREFLVADEYHQTRLRLCR